MNAPRELLRCPFCNNAASVLTASLYDGKRAKKRYYVVCTVCGCGIGMPLRNAPTTEDAAINRWNTRYDSEGRRIMF